MFSFFKYSDSIYGRKVFALQVIELDYGMKDKDPMEKVRFYKKDEDDHSIKIERNQVCIDFMFFAQFLSH